MRIEKMQPMLPNSDNSPINPFNQDHYHMGTYLGTNVAAMYANFEDQECHYLIILNRITGERIKIFPNE